MGENTPLRRLLCEFPAHEEYFHLASKYDAEVEAMAVRIARVLVRNIDEAVKSKSDAIRAIFSKTSEKNAELFTRAFDLLRLPIEKKGWELVEERQSHLAVMLRGNRVAKAREYTIYWDQDFHDLEEVSEEERSKKKRRRRLEERVHGNEDRGYDY